MKEFKPFDGEIRVCKLDYTSEDYMIMRYLDADKQEYWDNKSTETRFNKTRYDAIASLHTISFFVKFTISNRKNGLNVVDANEFAEFRGFTT
jgi:hypothetical protein